MDFIPHSGIDAATQPRLGQRVAKAALDVATSPLPTVALVSLAARAIRRSRSAPRREARDVVVAGPALA